MNALVKKEVRLLLPVWLGALGLVLASVAGRGFLDKNLAQTAFNIAVLAAGLLIGLAPFGQELKTGTLVGLLMQPVSRGRLLAIKLGLTLTAVLSVWALAAALDEARFGATSALPKILLAIPSGHLLVSMAVLATGGLWTTLLCRQTSPAFWLTLLAPLGLVLLADWFAINLWWMAAIYGIAGFVFAIVLFLRWQEVPQTATRFFAQANTDVPVSGFGLFNQRRGPWTALWAKELQLHREGLLVALTLLALHLAAMMGDRFKLFAEVSSNSGISIREMSRHCFVLWLIVPIFIGCRAVAEERRLNTLGGLWCLPVSRTRQTALKLACAVILGCLFGGIAPWLLEHVRNLIGLDSPLLDRTAGWDSLRQLVGISALLVFVSFYASTLSRQMLQAFGLMLVAGGFMALSFVVFLPWAIDVVPWSGKLGPRLGWPLLGLAVLVLIFRNTRRVEVGSSDLFRNFALLAGTILFSSALSTAIHHRVWDGIMNPEPRHGAAKIQGNAQIIGGLQARTYVLLDDGRLWVNGVRPMTQEESSGPGPYFSYLSPTAGRFLDGGPWESVASGSFLTIGLKKDGTLWNLYPGGLTNEIGKLLPVRIGSDSDWTQVAVSGGNFLALKSAGTVWGWNIPPPKSWDNRMNLAPFSPGRLGRSEGWTNVVFWFGRPYSHSAQGELFRWSVIEDRKLESRLVVSLEVEPVSAKAVQDHNFTYERGTLSEDAYSVRRMPDGSLKWEGPLKSSDLGPVATQFTLSAEPVWQQVAQGGMSYDNVVVALKNDGTLWRWTELDLRAENESPGSARPKRISRNNDWIALDSSRIDRQVRALAADGSLWLLPHVSDRDRVNSLLAPRSTPMKLANLFDPPAP